MPFQQAVYSPVKSGRVVLPSPQKADIPAASPALKSVSSPQKSSIQGSAFPSNLQKASPQSSTSVPQSPLKNQAPSRGLYSTSSPQKPELCAKPTIAAPTVPQEKASAGAPGELIFILELFDKISYMVRIQFFSVFLHIFLSRSVEMCCGRVDELPGNTLGCTV